MKRMGTGLLMASMACASAAIADDELDMGWHAEVSAGIIMTSGNTDTDSLNANAQVINEREYWRHTGKAEAYNSSQDGNTTAERYFGSVKSDYKLGGGANYIFGLLQYESDRFSGYDYESSQTVGYGRNVIKRPDMTLDLEIGAGARQRKERLTGDSENEAIIRGAGAFEWAFSEQATFAQQLSVEAGDDATITTSLTSLTSQLVGNLAARLAVRVKHVSDVPEGVENTDTETTATLVYKF